MVLSVLGTSFPPPYELLLVKDAVAGPWGSFPLLGSSLVLWRGTDRPDCVPWLVC